MRNLNIFFHPIKFTFNVKSAPQISQANIFDISFNNIVTFFFNDFTGYTSKFCKKMFSRIVLSFIGALTFFIISNFGVWISGTYYDISAQGLLNCYIMAIPFFTNTLLSTMLFAVIFELFISSKYFYLIPNFNKK